MSDTFWRQISRAKAAHRKRSADLPLDEKVKTLERLRERARVILGAAPGPNLLEARDVRNDVSRSENEPETALAAISIFGADIALVASRFDGSGERKADLPPAPASPSACFPFSSSASSAISFVRKSGARCRSLASSAFVRPSTSECYIWIGRLASRSWCWEAEATAHTERHFRSSMKPTVGL